MKPARKKATIADRIVSRLQAFTEALESSKGIARFTQHTMTFDLEPPHYDPAKVRSIREGIGASQAVFARLLGISVRTVRSWEQGINHPNGIACRFLDEIKRDPNYWIARLKKAIVLKK